jgi:histone demethylase JARID1
VFSIPTQRQRQIVLYARYAAFARIGPIHIRKYASNTLVCLDFLVHPLASPDVYIIDVHEPDTYVNTKEMLDNFSKEIVYMKMLPPYTQTLFVELMRFTPGQPDGLYTNGHSHRHSGTPTMGRQAVAAAPSPHSRHIAHPPMQASPPLNGFVSDRPMTIASQHVPPPPPWSRWSTMTVPPAVTLPQGHVPTPPSSRKRKFVDATPAGMAESSASAKRNKPQTPSNPSPRPSQTVSSPSLAKVLAPSDSQPSPRPTASTSMPSNQLPPSINSTPSRTSTPVRSVKLVVSKKQDS